MATVSNAKGRPHRGVVRLLFGVDYMEMDTDSVFLQLAPPSFDASTFEIWGALLHGGPRVLYPGSVPDLPTLGRVLEQEGVTHLWLPASPFNLVIDENPSALACVGHVLTGGGAQSVDHVRRAPWRQQWPDSTEKERQSIRNPQTTLRLSSSRASDSPALRRE